jgi:hypothetical protein
MPPALIRSPKTLLQPATNARPSGWWPALVIQCRNEVIPGIALGLGRLLQFGGRDSRRDGR